MSIENGVLVGRSQVWKLQSRGRIRSAMGRNGGSVPVCCPCAIQIRRFGQSYGLFLTTQGPRESRRSHRGLSPLFLSFGRFIQPVSVDLALGAAHLLFTSALKGQAHYALVFAQIPYAEFPQNRPLSPDYAQLCRKKPSKTLPNRAPLRSSQLLQHTHAAKCFRIAPKCSQIAQ